jgi:general secretion pathway protein G
LDEGEEGSVERLASATLDKTGLKTEFESDGWIRGMKLAHLLAIGLAFTGNAHGFEPKFAKARIEIQAIRNALDLFQVDQGHYPGGTNGLMDLVVQPTNSAHWIKYYDMSLTDPWGHPYVYRFPGLHKTNSFDLYSCGADGISKSGGDDADDINDWDANSPRDKGEFVIRITPAHVWAVSVTAAISAVACYIISWRRRKRADVAHG